MSAVPTFLPAEPTREEWLERRRLGIGSSDIAALAGADPYRTPLDVWLDKTGREPDGIETRPMRLGKRLEPIILGEYQEETGRRAILNGHLYQHRDVEIALATPDAFEIDLDRDGIELKAPGVRQKGEWGKSGTDEIPENYLAQVAWQMFVTGRTRWHVAALFGNEAFRVYRIERDLELEGGLVEIAQRFWRDHVVTGKAPALDASESARRYVHSLYPRERGALVEVKPDSWEESLVLELAQRRAEIATAEEKAAAVETRVKALIGDAEGLVQAKNFKVTWKKPKDSTKTDWEALARELGASPLDVERHTTTHENTRRFLASGRLFTKE